MAHNILPTRKTKAGNRGMERSRERDAALQHANNGRASEIMAIS